MIKIFPLKLICFDIFKDKGSPAAFVKKDSCRNQAVLFFWAQILGSTELLSSAAFFFILAPSTTDKLVILCSLGYARLRLHADGTNAL